MSLGLNSNPVITSCKRTDICCRLMTITITMTTRLTGSLVFHSHSLLSLLSLCFSQNTDLPQFFRQGIRLFFHHFLVLNQRLLVPNFHAALNADDHHFTPK